MSLDLYQRDDIRYALEALNMSSASTAGVVYNQDRDGKTAAALRNYRQGYTDALMAVGAAFGVVQEVLQMGAGCRSS